MCRRILTHKMHHDVRIPMIIDIDEEDPDVCINPRRTRYHRCELSPPPPGELLLNTPFPTCEYHSCCMVSVSVEFCVDFRILKAIESRGGPSTDGLEPEECAFFTLEHQHRNVRYFGRPEAYPERHPATWDVMAEIECDWLPWFKPGRAELARWQERFFRACERLYQLEQDARTQFLVYRDLVHVWSAEDPQLVIAEVNVGRAQVRLTEQKQEIDAMIRWARGLPLDPPKGFVPMWWLRMWALKGEYTPQNRCSPGPDGRESSYTESDSAYTWYS